MKLTFSTDEGEMSVNLPLGGLTMHRLVNYTGNIYSGEKSFIKFILKAVSLYRENLMEFLDLASKRFNSELLQRCNDPIRLYDEEDYAEFSYLVHDVMNDVIKEYGSSFALVQFSVDAGISNTDPTKDIELASYTWNISEWY